VADLLDRFRWQIDSVGSASSADTKQRPHRATEAYYTG